MKILVFYSGGKDSQASLIWAVKEYGVKNFQAVFCDTGWESQLTYDHIKEITGLMGVELVTLKSQKYDGFLDLAKKKGRFPSTTARFCTEELKSIPAIDYVLSLNDHTIVIQGIRKDESFSRSKMESQCSYFKFYFQPYGYDKKGKPKFHTYRKKDVFEYCKKYNADVLRPIFDWTAQQTIDYILENGQRPNPLYSLGFSRVGCFPCIMCRHKELLGISKLFPERIELLDKAEKESDTTFFAPGYIPAHQTQTRSKKGVKINTIKDVERYVMNKNSTGDLFLDEGDSGFSCMSYYGLCE